MVPDLPLRRDGLGHLENWLKGYHLSADVQDDLSLPVRKVGGSVRPILSEFSSPPVSKLAVSASPSLDVDVTTKYQNFRPSFQEIFG